MVEFCRKMIQSSLLLSGKSITRFWLVKKLYLSKREVSHWLEIYKLNLPYNLSSDGQKTKISNFALILVYLTSEERSSKIFVN